MAADLWDAPVDEVIGYYELRMGLEQGFRDQKACRYGLGSEWTRHATLNGSRDC